MDRSTYFILRTTLKEEWTELWSTKHDDKLLFESASSKDYQLLEVGQGQIIRSSRPSDSLDFYTVLEEKYGKDDASKISPDPSVGGWNKFAKTHLPKNQRAHVDQRERPKLGVDLSQPQRKNGAGWLNQSRIWKKIRENG